MSAIRRTFGPIYGAELQHHLREVSLVSLIGGAWLTTMVFFVTAHVENSYFISPEAWVFMFGFGVVVLLAALCSHNILRHFFERLSEDEDKSFSTWSNPLQNRHFTGRLTSLLVEAHLVGVWLTVLVGVCLGILSGSSAVTPLGVIVLLVLGAGLAVKHGYTRDALNRFFQSLPPYRGIEPPVPLWMGIEEG